MKISSSNFMGAVPKYSPLLLEDNYAQAAVNCKLLSGQVRPLFAPKYTTQLVLAGGTIQSLYLWRVNATQFWLRFAALIDVIRSPIADDAYSRIYWSGEDRVMYSYTPAVYSGGDQFPVNKYRLGIPAPTTPPIASTDIIPPASESTEARYYVLTYVGKLGEEGPPSQPSNMLIVPTAATEVTLTNLAVDDSAQVQRELVAKRLYRTAAGSSSAAFQFVAQLDLGTETYVDTLLDNQLAEVLQTTTWSPPRDGMQGLGLTEHGMAYGFVGKILCLSEPFRPYAWPRNYELTAADDIVAVGHYDSHLIVATNGRPIMVTGIDPASVDELGLPLIQACVSKRSMVSMGYCAMYASPNGLVMATASGAKLVTEDLFSRDDWQALNPASIHAYEHRGMYLFFWRVSDTQRGGFLFNPLKPGAGILTTDAWYQGGTHDLTTDTLFMLDDTGSVFAWEGDTAAMTFRWRSKIFNTHRPVQFCAARVIARSYENLVFRVFADGVLRHQQRVLDIGAFRLPRDGMALQWVMEVEGTDWVDKLELAQAINELKDQ